MNENTDPQLPNEIKWRGATYKLDGVEGDNVYWTCTLSRHSDTCSVKSWKDAEPYGDRIA